MFLTWFRNTAALSLDQGTLIVGLPLPMFLNWHLEHYRELTLQAAKTCDPAIENIVYQVDISLSERDTRVLNLLQHFPDRKSRKIPHQPAIRLPEGVTSKILNPCYTLDNFIAGSSTRLAHAACTAVAMEPGGKYNPLFIYGGVGLGKTHLLQATGNAILRNTPTASVLYTTSEDFTNQVVEAIAHKKMEQFHKRYRSIDVLIIDDIQFIANKERTQEIFFHTFNTLYEYQKQVIISSDRPPKDLTLLQDRLRSRFDRGMIADVQPPDYETRLAILHDKARNYGLLIDSAVLQYIAERVTLNVRSLEGILMQAIAQYELEHTMPTLRSIEEILQKLQGDTPTPDTPGFLPEKQHAVTLTNVLEGVSGYYSVSLQDIVGESRVREVLIPRQIAMYIGKKKLQMSYVRLGEVFSGRDHTTVMHAVEKIEKKMQEDPQLLREIRAIEKEVGLMK
jgi:chromosomal replication initiator protein